MSSIRRRLLFNLMLLFTVSWLAVTAATYYEARHEIEELFDAQLAQAAGIIADLVIPALETAELRKVELGKRIYGHKYEKHIGFQIWLGEKRAFRSQNVPELNRSRTTGFSDEEIDGETWRVFGFNIEGSDYRIYVGENYQARKELIRHITRDALLLLLWAIPLLAILGWLGIGHGLIPLIRITQEVSNRNPNQLDAIDSTRVPEEIQPLTQSLNALFDRLKEALDTERRFTADAAHELRTPLAGIKTQAQVSLRATDDDQRTQALENIVQGVDHGTHLVAQMLTLARLEPDAIDQDFQVMDLKEVAEKTVADLVPFAASNDTELGFTSDCPANKRCRIKAYAPGLSTLLRNLIDNAIRYTPAGGEVEVAIADKGKGFTLTITDNGPGIPESEHQRIFDRFYRPAGEKNYGCGLGLSIVKRIAQLHQSDVSLGTPSTGQGLRVSLVFKKQ